ncbi:MAG: DM13 domain-containing protein [Candidatus Gracilibacteria bacterium]|nr:DM13 domain-containing protein [Candidatus Gracilibacteria bacterium]
MKIFILQFFLIVILVFSLSACQTDTENVDRVVSDDIQVKELSEENNQIVQVDVDEEIVLKDKEPTKNVSLIELEKDDEKNIDADQIDSKETTIQSNPVIQEVATEPKNLSGVFIGSDHDVSGQVSLKQNTDGTATVTLGSSFSTEDGPELHVYLSNGNSNVDLGDLKSLSGPSSYSVAAEYADYSSVLIWCKPFGVLFGSAELQ